MSSFRRATRARGKEKSPTKEDLPPAAKKLMSDGWSFPDKGRSRIKIDYSAPQQLSDPKKLPASVDVVTVGMPDEQELEKKKASVDEPYFRFLCETKALSDLLDEAAICSNCKKGKLKMKLETFGLATIIHTRCNRCGSHSASDIQKTEIPREHQTRNSDFAVNCLFVLAQLLSGDGSTETSKLIGLTDLPRPTTFGPTTFPEIENVLSYYVIPCTEELMEANLIEEVRQSMVNVPDFDLDTWKDHWQNNKPMAVEDCPRISIS